MPANQQDIQAILRDAATAYHADYNLLDGMTRRESGYRDAVNNWDSNAAAGTPSAGILQFIKPTFEAYARHAREANPRAWQGVADNWRDPRAQALAAAWAVTNGHGSAWSTYKAALKDAKGGGAPPPPATPGVATASGALAFQPASSSATAGLFDDSPVLQHALEHHAARMAQTPAPPAQAAQVPSGMSAGASGGIGHDWKSIKAWAAQNFGLLQDPGDSQSTGGKHAAHSLHYVGKADDFGDGRNDKAKLMQLAAYARQHPEQFKEFFYNPAGFGIRDGKVVEGMTVPGHDNHAHIGAY